MKAIRFLVMLMVLVRAEDALGDVQTALDSAFVDVIRGNYYGAMVRYEDVLAADSTVVDAYRFLGWLRIATARDDLKEAGDYLRRAVELKPDDAGTHNDLGYVYTAQNNFVPAVEAFQKAVNLQPDAVLYRRNLGFAAEKKGDYALAESAFQAAMKLGPLDDVAAYGYGLSLSRQERYEEALQAFRKAVYLFADRKEAHAEAGMVLVRSGDFKGAAAAYERAKKIDFEDPKPHYSLAQIYRQLGDSLRADQEWKTFKYFDEQHRYEVRGRYILQVQLDRIADFIDRGLAYVRLGRYEDALDVYREGLVLAESPDTPYRFSPEIPFLHLGIGQAHQALGEVADARRFFDAARAYGEGGPVEDRALQGLADLFLFAEGLPGVKVWNFERIVAMDPTASAAFWIYDQITKEHSKAGRLDRCIAAYERMAEIAPYSAGMLVRLGVAYAAAGRLDDAAGYYKMAMEGVEDPTQLYSQLATLFRRAGRVAEADSLVVKAKRDEK